MRSRGRGGGSRWARASTGWSRGLAHRLRLVAILLPPTWVGTTTAGARRRRVGGSHRQAVGARRSRAACLRAASSIHPAQDDRAGDPRTLPSASSAGTRAAVGSVRRSSHRAVDVSPRRIRSAIDCRRGRGGGRRDRWSLRLRASKVTTPRSWYGGDHDPAMAAPMPRQHAPPPNPPRAALAKLHQLWWSRGRRRFGQPHQHGGQMTNTIIPVWPLGRNGTMTPVGQDAGVPEKMTPIGRPGGWRGRASRDLSAGRFMAAIHSPGR